MVQDGGKDDEVLAFGMLYRLVFEGLDLLVKVLPFRTLAEGKQCGRDLGGGTGSQSWLLAES
jgi:hypothetical protein